MKNRNEIIQELKNLFPGVMFKPSEEFSPECEGGIWTGMGEEFRPEGDILIYDYYHGSGEPECPQLKELVERHGLFCEPYDPGTIFIYEA